MFSKVLTLPNNFTTYLPLILLHSYAYKLGICGKKCLWWQWKAFPKFEFDFVVIWILLTKLNLNKLFLWQLFEHDKIRKNGPFKKMHENNFNKIFYDFIAAFIEYEIKEEGQKHGLVKNK